MHLFLNTLIRKIRHDPKQALTRTTFRPFAQAVHAQDQAAAEEWWQKELEPLPESKWPIDFSKTPDASPMTNRQFDAVVSLHIDDASRLIGVSAFAVATTALILCLYKKQACFDPGQGGEAVVTTSYSESSS